MIHARNEVDRIRRESNFIYTAYQLLREDLHRFKSTESEIVRTKVETKDMVSYCIVIDIKQCLGKSVARSQQCAMARLYTLPSQSRRFRTFHDRSCS